MFISFYLVSNPVLHIIVVVISGSGAFLVIVILLALAGSANYIIEKPHLSIMLMLSRNRYDMVPGAD